MRLRRPIVVRALSIQVIQSAFAAGTPRYRIDYMLKFKHRWDLRIRNNGTNLSLCHERYYRIPMKNTVAQEYFESDFRETQ